MRFRTKVNSLLRLLTLTRRPRTAAVILAGGVGSRMQNKDHTTKQLLTLGGIPVVIRSLTAFDQSPYIDELVLVIRKEEKDTIKALLEVYKIKKPLRLVAGGETRQLSAISGFLAISQKAKFVAIHDAARCLVTEDMIAKVVSAAYADGAASAAAPVHDTVKQVDKDRKVIKTLDRATLWRAGTPQVFRADLYRAAAFTAQKEGFEATDDNMLAERIGYAVRMVDCGEENIKLTTKTDLYIAEAILRSRGEK